MRFVVYEATPYSGTLHRILRWGDAPVEMVGIQAGTGEVAVAAATFPPEPSTASGGYIWNSASSAWSFVGQPEPSPDYGYQWSLDAEQVKAALTDSLWSQCAGSGLTGPQIAAMASWRQGLRSWLTAGPGSGPIALPPMSPPHLEY